MSISCAMIVDDSEADQFLCKLAMEEYKADIKLLQAYDGQEALEILDGAAQQPDVIFLDINMPRMNGHEFLDKYEQREGSNAAVVVMLTSSSQKKDKERSMAHACVVDYLEKPLDAENIIDISKLI